MEVCSCNSIAIGAVTHGICARACASMTACRRVQRWSGFAYLAWEAHQVLGDRMLR